MCFRKISIARGSNAYGKKNDTDLIKNKKFIKHKILSSRVTLGSTHMRIVEFILFDKDKD